MVDNFIPAVVNSAISPFFSDDKVIFGAADGNASIRIVSYQNDFKYLWGTKFYKWVNFGGEKTIVLVWDGMPEKENSYPLNTTRYLTPLDWAVYFSLSIEKDIKTGNKEYPSVRLFIIDFESKRNSNADSVKFFNQYQKGDVKALPWVRLIAPNPADEYWCISDLIANLLSKDKNADFYLPSMRDSIKQSDLEFIQRYWASAFVNTKEKGDHHSLSNIIGPLILANAGYKDDTHIKALKQMLVALGLAPEIEIPEKQEKKKKLKKVYSLSELPQIIEQPDLIEHSLQRLNSSGLKNIDLMLLDDMALKEGWGEVLCSFLNIDYNPNAGELKPIGKENIEGININIYASTGAGWLVEKINKNDQRYRFDICPNGKNTINPAQILFLDLRLFSGQDKQAEKAFIESLLPIAKQYQCSADEPYTTDDGNNTPLPWCGFTVGEIEVIKKWLDNPARETAEYFIVLTLLPRLIALTDFSLPIVLFSSTGKREITERLKPYGNIITSFDKPRFFGQSGENIVKDTKEKFNTAFNKALDLIVGRVLCANLNNEKIKVPEKIKLNHTNNGKPSLKVELFLDETGDALGKYTVGGLLVISNKEFYKDLRYKFKSIESHIWDNNTPKTDRKDQLRNNRSEIIEQLEKKANNNIWYSAIALTKNTNDKIKGENHIERIGFGDNVNRMLLSEIFEITYYIFLRHLINSETSIKGNIYAAQRTLPGSEFNDYVKIYLKKHWGLHSYFRKTDEEHIITFQKDDVMPIISNISTQYIKSGCKIDYTTIRAFSINSTMPEKVKTIKPLHYLADAILDKYHTKQYNLKNHNWWKKGFEVEHRPILTSIIKANRLYLNGEYVKCLLTVGFDLLKVKKEEQTKLIYFCWVDMQDAVSKLDGTSFLSLCAGLGNPLGK